ncbi:hypothetical protein [Sphingomonas sp. PB4P5]|uniref:hypothetical protein n=1 Tax=Parasphingomonas puruogangriensis TaxID=3096155 RepID=UPI002FCAC3F5
MKTINFAQLESGLASIFLIASEKRSAFTSRLKNLQRLGLCANACAGRGISSQYTFDQVGQFIAALELSQLGLSPERAVETIDATWTSFQAGLEPANAGHLWIGLEVSFLSSLSSEPQPPLVAISRSIVDLLPFRRLILLDLQGIWARAAAVWGGIEGRATC